ncbi:ABC transporter substrate-binding protein [Chryseoglobus sp. 28M-23]|uniref:ABC transporter substrate-binding protein n=1 Tax=Chryseoglobus sp. 28M-23 TaxID=2772253 RepID=UPI001746E665|nr:ABC transporter substrate-binding protein [Chryseoglobus sp. 28M-23]QOD93904.1 ABC transporter substrate-binding protein [Chryseoglobus sp. 28M-23]
MRTTPRAASAVLVAAALGLTACSGLGPMPTPSETPSAVATVEASGDGVLRIGTLFPTSGDISFIGPALVAAAEVAVRDVNAAGGVLGEPVEIFHRDSGDASGDDLESAMADLLELEVDVIIGPATSVLAERIIPLAAEAGVTVISPAATYPSLRAQDEDGVLFRTIPSYENQGALIAQSVLAAGGSSIVLVTDDDELGLALEASIIAGLADEDALLGGLETLTESSNLARMATDIAAVEPDAVVIATTTALDEQTRGLIVALAEVDVAGRTLWLTSQNMADYSATLPEGVLEGAYGVLEGTPASDQFIARLRQSDPALRSFRYAVETYDAVVLAALAALEYDDDGGPSIAAGLPRITAEGYRCGSVAECRVVHDDRGSFHYVGLVGDVAFDASGDVTKADYGLYRYSEENRPVRIGTLRLR